MHHMHLDIFRRDGKRVDAVVDWSIVRTNIELGKVLSHRSEGGGCLNVCGGSSAHKRTPAARAALAAGRADSNVCSVYD